MLGGESGDSGVNDVLSPMIEELVSGIARKFPVGAIALRFEGLPALSA
jgi:hypothetical protein